MSGLDLDTDEVLNPELAHYHLGYEEGIQESSHQQLLEGREYGYQTGFQRFIIIGYIDGIVKHWRANANKYDSKTLVGHLDQLQDFVRGISFSNDEEDVKNYETLLSKARNKVRLIANLVKESDKINKLDELVQEVGGNIHISENLEEMW
jgi:hypothetical protein